MAVPRLTAGNTTLLIVDVQEKLLPAIPDGDRLVSNVAFLLDTAALVDLPVRVTEQYPKGLGATVAALSGKLPAERPAKKSFSCCGAPGLVDSLDAHRPWILLAGMETHVCVSQTAFDLLDRGYRVAIPVDGVSARLRQDHDTALSRLRRFGRENRRLQARKRGRDVEVRGEDLRCHCVRRHDGRQPCEEHAWESHV